jgi:uncharacterized membrane protein YgdD (TMEM256/DUF423 family)
MVRTGAVLPTDEKLALRARWLAAAGALLGLTAVAAGAFGDHALKTLLPPARMAIYETAVRYHALHGLALFATAWVLQTWPGRLALGAGACLAAGTVAFCGSLYAVAMTGDPHFGLVTPVGGVGLLAGWAALAIAIIRPGSSPGSR